MNGITMWRLDPEFYGRNRSRTHVAMLTSTQTCTNRANSRRSDSGQTMAKQGQTTYQGIEGLTAAGKDAAGPRAIRKGPPPALSSDPHPIRALHLSISAGVTCASRRV